MKMACFKLKWKLPSWLRFRGMRPERQRRHNLPVPERIVPRSPSPPPPPPSPTQDRKKQVWDKGPGFFRLMFRGKTLKMEAWEELNTDVPFGAVAYHRAEMTTREDEKYCAMFRAKREREETERMAERYKKTWFLRDRTPEEVEMMMKKELLKQISRDIIRLGKYDRKSGLEFLGELKEFLAALSECDNPRVVKMWEEEEIPKETDPLEGSSDAYLTKQFQQKAPLRKPKLCEPWAEPAKPLTPKQLEHRQKAQRNRFHSELTPNDRDMWKLSKWHYDRRPEHDQLHYLPNHELPSRPGQFELEDLQRALAPILPATPDLTDELASTDSEEVREAIAAEHRESRRAGKREFSLPAHLKNFDPFAEDNRPKIPTVVASAPVTVQKPFPLVIEPVVVVEVKTVDEESAKLAIDVPEPETVEKNETASDDHALKVEVVVEKSTLEVAAETEPDADKNVEPLGGDNADVESETSFVDSELDLVIDVDDLLEIAISNISADEDAQNSDEAKSEVTVEPDTVKDPAPDVKTDSEAINEPAATKSPVQTIKLVMIEVEPPPNPPTPTNVVIVQAEVHPEPKANDEVPPPLPVKKKNNKLRHQLVHFPEDPDKIEVDKTFIESPKLKDEDPELDGAGQPTKVPRCLRNIRWSFFKPLQHPKNPPGMSKRQIVEQDLGEI